MSLINEALKRVEAGRAGKADGDDSPRELGPPAMEDKRPPRRYRGRLAVVVLIVLSTLWSMWLLFRSAAPDTPRQATANTEEQARASADKSKPEPGPAGTAANSASAGGLGRTQKGQLADDGQPAHPEATAAEQAPAADDASKDPYRLSAIIHGPDGATAIVNGKFLRVGQSVDGAEVIRIGQYAVVLEADGERITLQM